MLEDRESRRNIDSERLEKCGTYKLQYKKKISKILAQRN
jgi:hypothetical protein